MQSSLAVDQEKQDQRTRNDMEDPAAMTIDFLRARLLSERSVSKVARQRADELAKRVAELEEQLKVVTLQRKKAEKATAEVLAILENNDISGALDYNSDHDLSFCQTEDNNLLKKGDDSATSRHRTNEVEGLLVSEVESSSGRSLSWKGSSDIPSFLKKKIDIDKGRRLCSFLSTTSSSTKPRTGKSCRQIKRRETISEADNERDESFVPDAQDCGDGSVSRNDSGLSEDRPEIFDDTSGKQEDKLHTEKFLSDGMEEQSKGTNSGLDTNGSRREANLDRALENQAQLIDQYEAEEAAQREWEKKFKESKSYTPDSSEHGNQSDITEERAKLKSTTGADAKISLHGGARLESCHVGEIIAGNHSNGVLPTTCIEMQCSMDQQYNSCQVDKAETTIDFRFPSQENLGPSMKAKQKQDLSDKPTHIFSEPQPTEFSPFYSPKHVCNGESSGIESRLQIELYTEKPKHPKDVLEALEHAKSSLKHEFNKFPLSRQTWPVPRMSETSLLAIRSGEHMDIPFGCLGLFRVPTDFAMETCSHANLSATCSDFGSSLKKYQPSLEVAGTDFITQADVLHCRSDCNDSGLNFTKVHPCNGQRSSSSYLDMGLRNSSLRSCFDPCLDIGIALPPTKHTPFPSSYAHVMPRVPSNGGLATHIMSNRTQMPAGDSYSFFNEGIGSKMFN